MTLAPDRTCRLKFPVVAEELIEYSGARHGERSRRTSAGKLWVSEGKTFAAAVDVVVIGKCVSGSDEKASNDVAADGEFFFRSLPAGKFCPPLVSSAYYYPSTAIKTTKVIHKGRSAA